MLIPKKNRKAIYEHLFKEGVLVAKKDFFAPKHSEIETVPNLQVIKALQVIITQPVDRVESVRRIWRVYGLCCDCGRSAVAEVQRLRH